MCNEAQQITSSIRSIPDGPSSSVQVMRISDASGHYEDVILRPKGELNRRLARPLAVISSLFKSNRENSVNHGENEPKLPYDVLDDDDGDGDGNDDDDKNDQKKFKKRTSWNIFKSKRKNQRRMETPTFQHFQEPLNIERLSLPIGGNGTPIDLEWYDLNKEEMSLFEARMSDIVSEFNNYSQTSGESESESIYRCNLSRHLTISSNILWSHNLSVSCESNGNASNINLLGANINKDQINSDIYIENGEILAQNVSGSGQDSSFVSTDSDGYTVMPPFLSKKYIEPTNLIDSVLKSMDSHRNYDSDESSHLSSGFGSDTGDAQKSIPFINSPTTSNFSDAYPSDKSNECSPTISTTETAKNMQKISKKRRLRIQSRKLFGMFHVKHMPSSSSSSSGTKSQSKSQTVSNVMPTPQNKSPIECMKKAYKGTPFKIRLSKQPVRSLQI